MVRNWSENKNTDLDKNFIHEKIVDFTALQNISNPLNIQQYTKDLLTTKKR